MQREPDPGPFDLVIEAVLALAVFGALTLFAIAVHLTTLCLRLMGVPC